MSRLLKSLAISEIAEKMNTAISTVYRWRNGESAAPERLRTLDKKGPSN
jgi:transcriptional regulator with XRE-family HTH domain